MGSPRGSQSRVRHGLIYFSIGGDVLKTLIMIFIIAGMLSSVGVYAAGFGSTPTTKALAGSGNEAVSAPNTGTLDMGYVTSGGSVTGIVVTWTPAAAGDYDLTVVAGDYGNVECSQ